MMCAIISIDRAIFVDIEHNELKYSFFLSFNFSGSGELQTHAHTHASIYDGQFINKEKIYFE